MPDLVFRSNEFPSRWRTVQENIQDFGSYDLTYEELEYGCCLAWRNEPRCPARIQWKNLVSIISLFSKYLRFLIDELKTKL